MSSVETSKSRQSASQPLARQVIQADGGGAGRRPRQSAISRLPQCVTIYYREDGSSSQEPNNDTLNYACACEIFREEISERAQAHKFMWSISTDSAGYTSR